MKSSPDRAPILTVRVEDASMVPDGGPARFAVSGLPEVTAISRAVAAAHGSSQVVHGRLVVTAVPGRLVHASGRVGGAALAEQVRLATDTAVTAWLEGAPDLPLPGGQALPTSGEAIVQGVLNVTPDSFSDGGQHFGPDGDVAPAIEAGRALATAGAHLIDVGGESTRPGSQPVSADEELARTIPVVRALAADGVTISIDTTKAVVARAAVEAGAAIINDVSAGGLDPDLIPTVAELGVPYVLMHMQGLPRTMQQRPTYDDVVAEVFDHLAGHLRQLVAAGIPAERIVVDPGIGFGKTLEHNILLLRRLREFTSLGRPVLIGASRKSFIGRLTGVDDAADRLEGSLAAATLGVANGARIVRVHDVAETVRAVAVTNAITT